jgi:hypothetical protein
MAHKRSRKEVDDEYQPEFEQRGGSASEPEGDDQQPEVCNPPCKRFMMPQRV